MANTKVTALTADTSPTSDDLIPTVTDPAGTPASRKVTLANAITKAHGLSDGLVKVATGTMAVATANTDYATPNQDTTGKSAKTDALNSATTVVNVSAATAPTTGQALIATSSTAATWQTLAAGGDMVLNSVQTVTGEKTFGSAGAVSKLKVAGTTSGAVTLDTDAVAGTAVVTIPAVTDTLVGKATTDTLTNKTLTSPVINTPTGIVKGDVGLGNIDNTSDATKNAATVTLTNKTLTSPVIDTGVSGTAIDIDGTLAANSDTKLASQKATKTYVDTAVTGLLDFKGSTDTSLNPNYPAGLKGDAYIVSVAGKVGGASGKSVDVGDVYLATADNAGGTEASVGTSWSVLEHNLVGALLASNNLSDVTTPATARTNLGLAIGTNVQAYGATLTALEALTLAQGDLLYATAADTPANLAKGTASQQLRMNAGATAPEWFTPAASGGQTLVDIIVAASGGDYTTLGAALTAATTGQTIFVRSGTYTEIAKTITTTNLTIIGEGPESVVIDLNTINWTLSGAGLRISNVGFTCGTGGQLGLSGARTSVSSCNLVQTGTDSTAAWSFSAQEARYIGNYFLINQSSSLLRKLIVSGNYTVFADNVVYALDTTSNNTYPTIQFDGLSFNVTGNTFIVATSTTASCTFIMLLAAHSDSSSFSNNVVRNIGASMLGIAVGADGINCTINGNLIHKFRVGIQLGTSATGTTVTGNKIRHAENSASVAGIQVRADNNTITGNNIINNNIIGDGIYITGGSDTVVTGNTVINLGNGLNISTSGSSRTHAVGNKLQNCTVAIADAGTQSQLMSNSGTSPLFEKQMLLMKNTSGLSVAAGDLVTYKAVAAGDEFTTTVTAGSNLVYGMATATIANNAYDYVQVSGKTTAMKVDGTTDIAIGDYICTFTTVGIGQKAAAGNTAIAIALEAYTANDSLGVIDALIIRPRLI